MSVPGTSPLRLRVLVGESSPIVRSGLYAALVGYGVGWAAPTLVATCAEVRAEVGAAAYDIVLVSAGLDCDRGLAHHRRCIAELARHRVAVVHDPATHHLARVAQSAGAAGTVDLRRPADQLLERLRSIARARVETAASSVEHAGVPALARREVDVLVLYAEGLTVPQVANALQVSAETARTYLGRVRAKYALAGRPVRTRADFTIRAWEDAYLDGPPILGGVRRSDERTSWGADSSG